MFKPALVFAFLFAVAGTLVACSGSTDTGDTAAAVAN